MGLLDGILGGRKEPDPEDRLYLEPHAREVGKILQAEFMAAVVEDNTGFISSDGVVGVFRDDASFSFMKKIEPIGIGFLDHDGVLIGVREGSWFSKNLVEQLIKTLNIETVYVSRENPVPLAIRQPNYMITISPILQDI